MVQKREYSKTEIEDIYRTITAITGARVEEISDEEIKHMEDTAVLGVPEYESEPVGKEVQAGEIEDTQTENEPSVEAEQVQRASFNPTEQEMINLIVASGKETTEPSGAVEVADDDSQVFEIEEAKAKEMLFTPSDSNE